MGVSSWSEKSMVTDNQGVCVKEIPALLHGSPHSVKITSLQPQTYTSHIKLSAAHHSPQMEPGAAKFAENAYAISNLSAASTAQKLGSSYSIY